MAWDDPVRKHLPSFRLADPLADANVTMRDIVCHRTGLSRHDLLWYNSPWTREEIIARIGLVKLTKPFRSAYQYQNIMFLTAGEAVGRIAGTGWEEFLRRRIFQPLGMNNSDFSATEVVKARDANLGGNSMPECLRALLTDRLLGLPGKDWTKLYLEVAAKGEEEQKKRRTEREAKRRRDTKPSRELAAYAGAYEEPAYGTARVSLEAGKLTLSWSNWQVLLEHWQFDTFRAGGEEGGLADTMLTFRLNPDGDVEGLAMLDQEFARRKEERK